MENNRSNQTEGSEDPYERGFADKLYEDMDDVYNEPQYVVPDEYYPPEYTPRKKKRRWLRRLCIVLIILIALFVSFVGFLYFYSDCPDGDGGKHKPNVSTILVAGTDESGLRTDTLMLLCANRESGTIHVMSIPRDTKVNSSYWPQKINLAYHMNGANEEGMYWLMDYVRQCVGFMPDGYILVDLDCFVVLVDLFGGVEFDVPCDMYYSDPSQELYIDLKAGRQRLNGQQAMGLVRYRSGYTLADLERVNVQRDFIMAALDQWVSVKNITKLFAAMDILEEYCITDLSTRNFLWFAWSVLICGTGDMTMMTIPYYLNGEYVCIDASGNYLDLINQYFNPYDDPIEYDDLNIAY